MELAGGRVRINGGAILVIAAVCFVSSGELLLIGAFAVIVHEAGHYLAIKLCGRDVTSVQVLAAGFVIEYAGAAGYIQNAIIAAAGPLANILAAFAVSFFGRIFCVQDAYLFAGVSFVLGAFNLFPALPLDGGRILYSLVARAFTIEAAERVSCVASCVCIFALLVSGAAVLITTRSNPTLLVAGLCLLLDYCKRA